MRGQHEADRFATVILQVDVLDVSPTHGLHDTRNPFSIFRSHEEVNMICRQDVGVHRNPIPATGTLQTVGVKELVGFQIKAGIAVINALDDMVEDTGHVHARFFGA